MHLLISKTLKDMNVIKVVYLNMLKKTVTMNCLSVILNFLEKKFALICLINEQIVYSFPCMHRYKNNLNSWFAK